MRVLFVCSGNVKSFEIVPFIKEQGEALRRSGVAVDYYPVVGKGIGGYVKAGFNLRKYLQQNHYDLIHAHFTLSGWAAIIGAGSTPVVLSLMGRDAYGDYVDVNKVLLRSRYLTLLTLLIQPYVKLIISKSANIEQYVYMKKKSYIVPNGIDRKKFNADIEISKAALGLDPEKKHVLFLGSKTNVRKNFALVKAALARLNDPAIELISPYPVSHEEIPKFLNAVDVLVLPSLMEGSPNIIKEAMACNCPIVATDIGDVRWVFGNTKGCYLGSFDAADFSEKIKMALAYAQHQGRTKGAQRIRELGLDSEIIAERIIALYNLALNQYPRVLAG